MSANKSNNGSIGWVDLTVENAGAMRDFYQAVVGWSPSTVGMGDYEDYCMTPTGSPDPVAGICHARGANEGIPPRWLVYITVEDIDASIAQCEAKGGKIIHGPRTMGESRFVVIEDPAGAVCALYQP